MIFFPSVIDKQTGQSATNISLFSLLTCLAYNPTIKAAVTGVAKTRGVEKLMTCATIFTAETQHLKDT